MTEQHPITPPPELVEKWLTEGRHQDYCSATEYAIAQAAQHGADQELQACVECLIANSNPKWAIVLEKARRPKPPSLAEEALAELEVLSNYAHDLLSNYAHDLGYSESVIRRALERLQELEGGND